MGNRESTGDDQAEDKLPVALPEYYALLEVDEFATTDDIRVCVSTKKWISWLIQSSPSM